MSDKQVKEVQKAEREKLQRAFNRVASTPAGQTVLRYIMRDCGFQKTSIVQDPHSLEINTIGSIYNEARKDVYHRIRRFIDNEYLKVIEFKEDENV